MKDKLLIPAGVFLLILSLALSKFTNISDFLPGFMLGLGIGLSILGIYRYTKTK